MIQAAPGKVESEKNDEADIERILELELAQKRMAWQEASRRYRTLKTLSLFFLLIVVIGTIAAFLFFFSRINERRENQSTPPAATENP